MNRLWIISFVGACLLPSTTPSFASVYVVPNRVIPSANISLVFSSVSSACQCKIRCTALPSCTAVTVNEKQGGTFDCHLTEVNPVLYYDLQQQDAAFTIVNKDQPACKPPFKSTEFGCLCLFKMSKTFANARRLCGSYDADLLTLDDDTKGKALWLRLLGYYIIDEPIIEIWVGFVNDAWLHQVPGAPAEL